MWQAVRLAKTFRRPPRKKKDEPDGAETVHLSARERAEGGGVKWDVLRKRLVRARATAPLFRTEDFTRDFEGVLRDLLRKEVPLGKGKGKKGKKVKKKH